MKKRYFVVSTFSEMVMFKEDSGVIDFIGNIATNKENAFTINRIFAVDECGQVTFFTVAFENFKIVLKKVI